MQTNEEADMEHENEKEPRHRGRPTFPEGTAKESHLHIRLDEGRKAQYVRAAQRSPMKKLAPWVVAHLDEAAKE